MDKSFVILLCVMLKFILPNEEDCGGHLTSPKGIITTPNFPRPYKVPLSCLWVIQAPKDYVVAVYFTQYYMKTGLRASEYSYYSYKVKMGVDMMDFGSINSEKEPTYLITNKRILGLNFTILQTSNVHLRVMDSLLDVFGFNITYEMLPKRETVLKDGCFYHHCSFNGNCFADAQYDKYWCSCFGDYFGEECQYNMECGPESVKLFCENGGICRYYIGSTHRTCECPDGFSGARCELFGSLVSPEPEGLDSEVQKLTALQRYYTYYRSNSPFEGEDQIIITFERKKNSGNATKESDVIKPVENLVSIDTTQGKNMDSVIIKERLLNSLPEIRNLTIKEIKKTGGIEAKFYVSNLTRNDEALMMRIREMMIQEDASGRQLFDEKSVHIRLENALKILWIESSEMMPTVEGVTLILACIVQGPASMIIEWQKDGHVLGVHMSHGRLWQLRIPKSLKGYATLLLGIDRTHIIDSGAFTCCVRDGTLEQNATIDVEIRATPVLQVTPMTATVHEGESQVITCISKDDIHADFQYSWLKDGQAFNYGSNTEVIEDIFRVGSRVILKFVQRDVVFTCIIINKYGSARSHSVITVLKKDSGISCPQEEKWGVNWTETALGTVNTQVCPTTYTGYANRECGNEGLESKWKDPDFSNCLTDNIISIRREIHSIEAGYLSRPMADVLDDIWEYMQSSGPSMKNGEEEIIVDILEEVMKRLFQEQLSENSLKVFIETASSLHENKRIQKEEKLLKLHQVVVESVRSFGNLQWKSKSSNFEWGCCNTSNIDVEVLKLNTSKVLSINFGKDDVMFDITNAFDIWLTIDNNSDFNSTRKQDNPAPRTFSIVAYNGGRMIDSRQMLNQFLNPVIVSGVLSIIENIIEGKSIDAFFTKIRFLHREISQEKDQTWIITCISFDVSASHPAYNLSTCQLLEHQNNYTTCLCRGEGTFAVVCTPNQTQVPMPKSHEIKAIPLTGVLLCIILVTYTTVNLVFPCRVSSLCYCMQFHIKSTLGSNYKAYLFPGVWPDRFLRIYFLGYLICKDANCSNCARKF